MSKNDSLAIVIGILLFLGLVGGVFYIWPRYQVYQQTLAGEARLREAESSRQIRVLEAKAKKEAAAAEAEAEVTRAKGLTSAVETLGASLEQNPAYLNYLYINGLQEREGERETIYVPIGPGGLPLLPTTEAGRIPLRQLQPNLQPGEREVQE